MSCSPDERKRKTLTFDGIEATIHKLKLNMAPRIDDIVVDLLKEDGSELTGQIYKLIAQI